MIEAVLKSNFYTKSHCSKVKIVNVLNLVINFYSNILIIIIIKVIMARRRMVPGSCGDSAGAAGGESADHQQVIGATPKMICHVFESEEVSLTRNEANRFF